MRITLKKLEQAKACSRERKRFARLFPNGCELNEKSLRKWAKGKTIDGLDTSLRWFAVDCLGLGTNDYDTAGRLYWRALWEGAKTREQHLTDLIEFFKRKTAKRKRRKK